MKKVAILGTKFNTLDLLKNWNYDQIPIECVISLNISNSSHKQISGFATNEIIEFCRLKQIKVYLMDSFNLSLDSDVARLKSIEIDILFVNGWERILPKKVLDVISIGAFGMHGSARGLPRGRGRSPMNWALIMGERQFATSLFKYDTGMDSGKIFGTKIFSIGDTDDIRVLHEKNLISMINLITEFAKLGFDISYLVPQEKTGITYYPQRKPQDGEVDFNLTTKQIINLVRALSDPYPGAYFIRNTQRHTVERAISVEPGLFEVKLKPGTVHYVSGDGKIIYVECRDSVLRLELRNSLEINSGEVLDVGFHNRIMNDVRSRYPKFVDNDKYEI